MNLKGGEGSVKIFPHDYLLDSNSVFLQGLREGVKKNVFFGTLSQTIGRWGYKVPNFLVKITIQIFLLIFVLK